MRKRTLALLALLICTIGFGAETKVIRVKNQEQFNQLNSSIHNAVSEGAKTVVVKISSGRFYFHERHLSLGDIKNPGFSLKLFGKNTLLIAEGRQVSTDAIIKDYNYNSSLVDIEANEVINQWSSLKYADSNVEVIDAKQKVCRIKSNGIVSRSPLDCKDAYIMITAWCRTYYYRITRIEDSFIYFIADNLQSSRVNKNGYNVNDDNHYAKVLTRFRLCNIEPLKKGKALLCEAQTFLICAGGQMNTLSIKGISFIGNSTKGDLESSPCSLIVLNNIQANGIKITKCSFIGQNSRVIAISKTDNVQIVGNYFAHNFRNGITSYNSCRRTIVEKNVFEYNGESLSYERCVSCSGSDYYIGNNSFTNYGYCAISVGLYYGATPENPPGGIVEKNTLNYTNDWMENLWQHSIMDSGAIYLWTQNDMAIIRNNSIINYGGVCFNNGIYCDDGAKGMEIYGNVVMNVVNGYSIHSRRVSSVDNQVGEANVNNKIYDNFIDGGFMFVGHEGKNNCLKGRNFIVSHKGVKQPENIVSNISDFTEDDYVETQGLEGTKLLLERSVFSRIKQSQIGPVINTHFKQK